MVPSSLRAQHLPVESSRFLSAGKCARSLNPASPASARSCCRSAQTPARLRPRRFGIRGQLMDSPGAEERTRCPRSRVRLATNSPARASPMPVELGVQLDLAREPEVLLHGDAESSISTSCCCAAGSRRSLCRPQDQNGEHPQVIVRNVYGTGVADGGSQSPSFGGLPTTRAHGKSPTACVHRLARCPMVAQESSRPNRGPDASSPDRTDADRHASRGRQRRPL
jgi:hypothetical protein